MRLGGERQPAQCAPRLQNQTFAKERKSALRQVFAEARVDGAEPTLSSVNLLISEVDKAELSS